MSMSPLAVRPPTPRDGWDRQAADRINALLKKVDELELRLAAVEAKP